MALQCLHMLQIIVFSFISGRAKELEDNREKSGFFVCFGIFHTRWCETMVEDGSVLLHLGRKDQMIGDFYLCSTINAVLGS